MYLALSMVIADNPDRKEDVREAAKKVGEAEMLRNKITTLILFGLILCVAHPGSGFCQGLYDMSKTAPVTGGTIPTANNPKFGDALKPKLHMSSAGLPCVVVNAFSRPQIINPQIFDNVIILRNSCPDAISLNLCYPASDHCITPTIEGYNRREATLGSTASTKDFRYEYREVFK